MLRKVFDLIFGTILLFAAFPLLIIISIVIAIEIKTFPFFIQERGLTLEKNRFKIYKVRTLKKTINSISHIKEEDIFLKPNLKGNVTPFAKWLRKTGLDELPQLINVIKGEMSLIGPRPLMLEDLNTMKKVAPDLYSRRNQINNKPGISGFWQLFGNRNEGIFGMIALESLYEKVASPFLDLKLILYTSTVILQAKNSDSIFFTPRSEGFRVHAFIDNSSNLKVALNMPEGIAKFIIEKVNKTEGKYTVEIPSDWWFVSDSYETLNSKTKTANIYPILNSTKDDSKKNAS
jgi:lipopolysaccharide/colanic/teichoic acid biosynthesis glycosyltransferase